MNNKLHIRILAICAAALAAASFVAASGPEKPVTAPLVKGVQTITVTIAEGKYTPSLIQVVKGKPVEIKFKGGRSMGCGSTVVFDSLKEKKSVKEGSIVSIKFTPKAKGTISFHCPMKMYNGTVTVK